MSLLPMVRVGVPLAVTAILGWGSRHLGLRWEHVHVGACMVLLAWLLMGAYWAHQGGPSVAHAWSTLAACALIAGVRHAPAIGWAASLDWVGSPQAQACWGATWVALGGALHALVRACRPTPGRACQASAQPVALGL